MSWFKDAIQSAVDTVSNAVGDVVGTVGDVGKSVGGSITSLAKGVGDVAGNIIDTVKDHPLEAAALAAGGYYFAPEIGAWFNPVTGSAIEGTAAGTEAGALATSTPVISGTAEGTALGTAAPFSSGTGLAATGSQGLGAAGTANLGTMGGAQGLTGALANGTTVGATGGALANGGLGSTLGAIGAAGGTDAALGTAAGAAGAAGSTLGSMMPYVLGGQIVSGLMQAKSAKDAANIQSAAAQGATQLQGQMFNTINQQQAPYRTAGYQALNQIGNLGSGQYVTYDANGNPVGTATGTGYLTHQFDASDLAKGLAPNYDFMLQQGQMANQRAANAGGGGLSGNALQGLQKFTQDYAGNAYQNAFNNYQTQRSNIYNTLAGIAGIGQTGQTQTNQAGTNATNAASQLGVGSAAAQAAGMTGQANAMANTIGNVANTYMLSSLLNQRGSVAA